MSTKKPTVLVMADWFDPGFKAGGPIRSCVNFAGNLKNDLQIYVLTTDRDLGDTHPYNGISQNQWIDYEDSVQVFYASPGWLSFGAVKKLINSIKPDIIYLNSMYSRYFSLYPLLMKRSGGIRSKVILAPRGMLKQSAVHFKSRKKKLFLGLFRLLGLQRNIHFHCTDNTEQQDVKKYFGRVPSTVLTNNPGVQRALQLPADKKPGFAKLIFIGRMHPIKNVHYMLELMKNVREQVQLTIVAGMENSAYWDECRELIAELPKNITVHYAGELPHHELERLIVTNHAFILPTRGENFGHAIFESLAAGRPVIISDQTPWRHLSQHKAGWDISLDQPAQFAAAITTVANMDAPTLNEWCKGAWDFCKDYIEGSGIKEQYLKLFS